MLKVWGRQNSVNVQKVMWVIGELGLPHERIDAGRQFGKNREGWYLAMNPNGQIPTIDDNGLVLWESNAIVRYLVNKYGDGRLDPGSVEARAVADMWMDWQQTVLSPPMANILMKLVRTAPEERPWPEINQAIEASAKAFVILEDRLQGRDYLVGDSLSLADAPLGAMAYRWHAFPIERPDLPNLKAYYDRLATRPAFAEHVMVPLS